MNRTPMATLPTPQGAERSVVILRHKTEDGRKVKLFYLPHRLITTAEAFAELVTTTAHANTLEEMAAGIAESFYDGLVPFWVQVKVSSAEKNHSVVMMRLQPSFKLPDEYKNIVAL